MKHSKGKNVTTEDVANSIKLAGDDGISMEMLMQEFPGLGTQRIYGIVGWLIRQNKVEKHPELRHYFWAEETPKKKAKRKRATTQIENKVSEVIGPSTTIEVKTMEMKKGWSDRLLGFFGLQRING